MESSRRNYTSIEQSKKLLELGLSPDTADMSWRLINYGDEAGSRFEPSLMRYTSLSHFRDRIFPKDNTLPCWSVGALLDLMPDSIGCWDLQVSTFYREVWSCEYFSDGISAIKTSSPHLITAVYKMVILLLEQNYIKK